MNFYDFQKHDYNISFFLCILPPCMYKKQNKSNYVVEIKRNESGKMQSND